jgi:hypothetical protein
MKPGGLDWGELGKFQGLRVIKRIAGRRGCGYRWDGLIRTILGAPAPKSVSVRFVGSPEPRAAPIIPSLSAQQ